MSNNSINNPTENSNDSNEKDTSQDKSGNSDHSKSNKVDLLKTLLLLHSLGEMEETQKHIANSYQLAQARNEETSNKEANELARKSIVKEAENALVLCLAIGFDVNAMSHTFGPFYCKPLKKFVVMNGDDEGVGVYNAPRDDFEDGQTLKWTPLHLACHLKLYDSALTLLKLGAFSNVMDRNECTAIDFAKANKAPSLFMLALFQNIKSDESDDESTTIPLCHKGIICDNCKSENFTGLRWKCAHCQNYDLCDGCFTKRDKCHDSSHKTWIKSEYVEMKDDSSFVTPNVQEK